MWKRWLPNERYVTKPDGNLYTAVLVAQESTSYSIARQMASSMVRHSTVHTCFV